jgi:hypothetical protein
MSSPVSSKLRWHSIHISRRPSPLGSGSTDISADYMMPLGKENLELLQAGNNFRTPCSGDKALFLSSVT